jgi:antitoxin component YwqK of YwqJK toxin-antitoxin module
MKNEYFEWDVEKRVRARYEVNILNGKRCGDYYYFSYNGDTIVYATYKDDKLEGVVYHYFENGRVQLAMEYKDDVLQGLKREYYSNGRLKSGCTYKDDKLWTIHALYDSTGRPLDFGTLINGNGTVKQYYLDGNLNYVDSFRNGCRHGAWIFYTNTGIVMDSVEYVDGVWSLLRRTGMLLLNCVSDWNTDSLPMN